MRKNGVLLAIAAVAAIIFTACGARADELLRERARNLYEVQDYRGAYSLFERLLAENPDDGEALDYSAWCLRYFGDWKSAEERFKRALEAPSGALVEWLHVGLGETRMGAGNEKGALESFQRAIESAPEDLELVLRSFKGMAWASAFLGDEEGCERSIESARERDADYAASLAADVEAVLKERLALAAKIEAEKEDIEEDEEDEDELGIVVLDSQERQAKIFEEEILGDELDELIAEILAAEEKESEAPEADEAEEEPEPELDEADEIEKPESDVDETDESEADEADEDEPVVPDLDEADEDELDALIAETIDAVMEELGADDEIEKAVEKEIEKLEKPAAKPKPEKPAEAPVKEVSPPSPVWGVRIGEPIEREFDRADVEKLDRSGAEGAYGVVHYPFVPRESPFPSYVRAEAASTYFNIEAYKGNILKVHGAVKTRVLPNTLDWRKKTFDAMVDDISQEHGKPTIFTDQGIFFEAAWLLPETRVLWLFVDAGLDGACQVQLSYVDRRIQAGHLIGILK
ncbi:MAG: hypothetical protein GX181_06030 [Synergistaceae bacterium]|nr:hypothetical protein [Synergistota bacterium]NLM71497.1 hypothetical protein [Synergistaceae bacterium]